MKVLKCQKLNYGVEILNHLMYFIVFALQLVNPKNIKVKNTLISI